MRKSQDDVDITVFDYEHATYSVGKIDPTRSFRCVQTVVLFENKSHELPTIELHSGQNNPGLSTEFFNFFKTLPFMNIESNEKGMIAYEYEIKHPPEDLEMVILQRMRLFELVNSPTGLPPRTAGKPGSRSA
jgi:hypothetical protein